MKALNLTIINQIQKSYSKERLCGSSSDGKITAYLYLDALFVYQLQDSSFLKKKIVTPVFFYEYQKCKLFTENSTLNIHVYSSPQLIVQTELPLNQEDPIIELLYFSSADEFLINPQNSERLFLVYDLITNQNGSVHINLPTDYSRIFGRKSNGTFEICVIGESGASKIVDQIVTQTISFDIDQYFYDTFSVSQLNESFFWISTLQKGILLSWDLEQYTLELDYYNQEQILLFRSAQPQVFFRKNGAVSRYEYQILGNTINRIGDPLKVPNPPYRQLQVKENQYYLLGDWSLWRSSIYDEMNPNELNYYPNKYYGSLDTSIEDYNFYPVDSQKFLVIPGRRYWSSSGNTLYLGKFEMLDIPEASKETNTKANDENTPITDNDEIVNPKKIPNPQILSLTNEDIWLISLSSVVFVLLILVVWLIIQRFRSRNNAVSPRERDYTQKDFSHLELNIKSINPKIHPRLEA